MLAGELGKMPQWVKVPSAKTGTHLRENRLLYADLRPMHTHACVRARAHARTRAHDGILLTFESLTPAWLMFLFVVDDYFMLAVTVIGSHHGL